MPQANTLNMRLRCFGIDPLRKPASTQRQRRACPDSPRAQIYANAGDSRERKQDMLKHRSFAAPGNAALAQPGTFGGVPPSMAEGERIGVSDTPKFTAEQSHARNISVRFRWKLVLMHPVTAHCLPACGYTGVHSCTSLKVLQPAGWWLLVLHATLATAAAAARPRSTLAGRRRRRCCHCASQQH